MKVNFTQREHLLISIVSHGHGHMIEPLLTDLQEMNLEESFDFHIVLTLNIPEDEGFIKRSDIEMTVVRNAVPMGFGANQNQAFGMRDSDHFIVLNPDVRISDLSVRELISSGCSAASNWGCIAPIIKGPQGGIEDSARRYPTIARLLARVVLMRRKSSYVFEQRGAQVLSVDWVAGMFMLFRSDVFSLLGGFDERYFMYLEDADICRRTNKLGYKVLYSSAGLVVHDAQRRSLKSMHHFKWHIRSLMRFISSGRRWSPVDGHDP